MFDDVMFSQVGSVIESHSTFVAFVEFCHQRQATFVFEFHGSNRAETVMNRFGSRTLGHGIGDLRHGGDHLGLVAPLVSLGNVKLDVIRIAKNLVAEPTSSIFQIFVKRLDVLVHMNRQAEPFVAKVTSMDFGSYFGNVAKIMHFLRLLIFFDSFDFVKFKLSNFMNLFSLLSYRRVSYWDFIKN